jgi:hypothetical protein
MKTKGPKQDSQNCLIIINNNYIILATVNFDNEYTSAETPTTGQESFTGRALVYDLFYLILFIFFFWTKIKATKMTESGISIIIHHQYITYITGW